MGELKIAVSEKDHIKGSRDAPITLVEYGDYECPFCATAHPIIKKLQDHFKKDLRFVFRNFPLREIHSHSEGAAEAAEFAGSKDKFWQMHDSIYENQNDLSLESLQEQALKLGLEPKDIEIAILSQQFEDKIQNDFMGGVRSGVNGTPNFFINGKRYEGRPLFADMKAYIEKLL